MVEPIGGSGAPIGFEGPVGGSGDVPLSRELERDEVISIGPDDAAADKDDEYPEDEADAEEEKGDDSVEEPYSGTSCLAPDVPAVDGGSGDEVVDEDVDENADKDANGADKGAVALNADADLLLRRTLMGGDWLLAAAAIGAEMEAAKAAAGSVAVKAEYKDDADDAEEEYEVDERDERDDDGVETNAAER